MWALQIKVPTSTANVKQQQELKFILNQSCERISSSDACALIKEVYSRRPDALLSPPSLSSSSPYAYSYSSNTDEKSESFHNLLLITSDASRGANRRTGLASILREVNIKYNDKNQKDDENIQKVVDKVILTTRRIHTIASKDIFQSEVAALALGIRAALQHIPSLNSTKVILLTDSSSALCFFCSYGKEVEETGKVKPKQILDHPHYKALQSLVNKAKDVKIAKVRSAKLGVDGFFDHDVTDILSSYQKNVSNKEMMKQIFSLTGIHTVTKAPILRKEDLDYLEKSMNIESGKGKVKKNKRQVDMKRDSDVRLKRCRERIREELGIDLIS